MSELPAGAYLAPVSAATAEIREKGSRFRAHLLPVGDEEAAGEELQRLARQYPDATHCCWAWRLGRPARERFSDAGEPSGTAGTPILRVLAGAALSDVLAVVVRWFGGTKLGRGGLVRAYARAVREAAARLATEPRLPAVELTVEVPYAVVGAVKRLLHPPAVELVAEDYGETVRLVLRVALHRRDALEASLSDLQARIEERR